MSHRIGTRTRRLSKVAVAFLSLTIGLAPAAAQEPVGYVVVDSFPHDPEAFTQGLDFQGTRLFEGTGLEGSSELRRVDLESGDVVRRVSLADKHFGEGITVLDGKVYQITWQTGRAFVYDVRTFDRVKRFSYTGEGWGLTHNGRLLVMSDGTNIVRFRRPRDFSVKRRVNVTRDGEAVGGLNELEWINGEIFANVWPTDVVVRIDPSSGNVVGTLDLQALRQMEEAERDVDVTNGIAYMPKSDRLFVTGKFWSHVYEIRLTD